MRSDEFKPLGIARLLKWILAEAEQGEIFGIPRELWFIPGPLDPFRMRRYGRVLETPLGVAAGPHTQLSQNIISAWLVGARYLELKTVQVLDELEVTKPCIEMADEGYNCEWSQELKLRESFGEYLNAWILLHVLKDKLGWGEPSEPGFIFNMSVGYNLEGILSPPVQEFLDLMGNCPVEKAESVHQLAEFYPRIKDLEIPDRISDNITVSTMHGCPPDEVEKIGRYFIEERGLNTTIKLNPTLLGAERVRKILNDELGFRVEVPDLAFEHDLKYPDGVALIESLREAARKRGVEFNLKLTNTLETTNRDQSLPKNEAMVYLSGRPLHPISVNLAARLQKDFDGSLDISFSAGVDCFNLVETLASGLKPITVCSDLLKPGGYGRLSQYLENLGAAMGEAGVRSLQGLVLSRAEGRELIGRAALGNLQGYAARVSGREAYTKESHPFETIKVDRDLPFFDCATAPCVVTCPASQDIPRYMDYIRRGEVDRAVRTILATNPFPEVQGLVCDHPCRNKCTRLNYDRPLLIREIKRFAAERGGAGLELEPGPANGLLAAIIGAGPSGLACAFFLALAGFKVEVLEAKGFPGGMAADAIPAFRLDPESLARDIDRILGLGVDLKTGQSLDRAGFDDLVKTRDFVYVAVGAQKSAELKIPGSDGSGVLDQLEFLSLVRQGRPPHLGAKVGIIGGGNSALDAARTAKRIVGHGGQVTIIYRRTENEMPADREEVRAALEEGVEILELCAPEEVIRSEGRLTGLRCSRMELGEKDRSGRPRPVRIEGSEFDLELDSLIPAIGQKVIVGFCPEKSLAIDPRTLETRIENVFAGGDAVRGASSLIKAIADGHRAARSIMDRAGLSGSPIKAPGDDRRPDWAALKVNQARRGSGPVVAELEPQERLNFEPYVSSLSSDQAIEEAGRCLQCDIFCNVCTTVCPNRANIAVEMGTVEYPLQAIEQAPAGPLIRTLGRARIGQKYQILNIADFCNECGNCGTFCPSSGAPYRDKPKLHLSRESFEASANGFYIAGPDRMEIKTDGTPASLLLTDAGFRYEAERLKVVINPQYQVTEMVECPETTNLRGVAEMAVLFTALRKTPFLGG